MTSEARLQFIMPSGQKLSSYLLEQGLLHETRKRKKVKGGKRDTDSGWTKPAKAVTLVTSEQSDIEAMEQTALLKVGERRRRRWLNEKLLRDMAGPLTARDMESLFQPAPFGYEYESAIARVLSGQEAAVWNHFLSIDHDKQTRVLQRWEDHVRGTNEGALVVSPATDALQRWAAVPRKLRTALKATTPEAVAQLEHVVLDFVDKDKAQDRDADELVLQWDSFQRAIGHAVAAFHGLQSHSCNTAQGRAIVFRKPVARNIPNRPATPVSAPDSSPSGASSAADVAGQAAPASQGAAEQRLGPCLVSCAEVLAVVQEGLSGASCRCALENLLRERAHLEPAFESGAVWVT